MVAESEAGAGGGSVGAAVAGGNGWPIASRMVAISCCWVTMIS
jgi:hypothetical protein